MFDLAQDQQEPTFLNPMDLIVSVHYDDVVDRQHYETALTVRMHFEEARGGGVPAVTGLLTEPELAVEGRLVTVDFIDADPRAAHDRRVPDCAIPECLANR